MNVLNVFDCEATLAPQHTCETIVTLAPAGATLDEARAYLRLTGGVPN